MADLEIQLTEEEYELVSKAAQTVGETIEDFCLTALKIALAKRFGNCRNCGASAIKTSEGVKHFRSRAMSCDLDDPDSLTAVLV